jgi:hypothetical protein
VCLAVAVGVAPALLRLLDVLGRVVLPEHLEHLGRGQVDAHLVPSRVFATVAATACSLSIRASS